MTSQLLDFYYALIQQNFQQLPATIDIHCYWTMWMPNQFFDKLILKS